MKGQNTAKIWKKTILDRTRQLLSVILTSAMVFTNVGAGLNTVYASDADTVEFTIDSSQLLTAVRDAIADSQEITAADMDFTNGKIDEFEDYFFGSGKLLEAFPETEGRSMDAELRVFIRVPEDADETYMVTGSEDVIFLYVNNGDNTIRCTTTIIKTEDGKEKVKKTRSITVKDFETAYGDEDINYLSKPSEQPETTVPETTAPMTEETEIAAPENETTAPTEGETAPSEESETTSPEIEKTEAETEIPETEETAIETAAPEESTETPEKTEAESQDEENDTSLEDTIPAANISRHESPIVAWSAFRGG